MASSTPDGLRKGLTYRHRPDRPDNPHQFGVWDNMTRRYRRQSFSRKDEGLAWAKRQQGAMDRGDATAIRPRLSEIGDLYIERLKVKGSHERHQERVAEVITQLAQVGATDFSADDFPDRVQRWINWMTCAHRRGPDGKLLPSSPTTKRQCLTIARSLCHLAMKMRLLRWDPLAIVVTPRVERREKPVFSVPELRRMLSDQCRWRRAQERQEVEDAIRAAAGDKRAAAEVLGIHLSSVYNRLAEEQAEDPWWWFTVLALYTGARASEVQGMTWGMVQWGENVLLLPASVPGNKMRLDRVIPLQPELRALLAKRCPVGTDGPIVAALAKAKPSERTHGFKAFLGRFGLETAGRGPHSLRHNHASLAAAQGVSLADIMRRLGHENVKVSLGYSRTAARFQGAVRGWGIDRFWLRDEPPPLPVQPALPWRTFLGSRSNFQNIIA